ncbi:unnamed protein product [Withania somnifera]
MLQGKRTRPPMKRTTSMTEFPLDLNLNTNYNIHPHNNQQCLLNRNRRKSADFVETANFLKACFLCKRRLIPGRDIYMYRGDSAFCSLECRQQQMNIDEKKEKCSLVASFRTNSAGNGSDVSTTSETVAAV